MKIFLTINLSILICSIHTRLQKRADLILLLRNLIGENSKTEAAKHDYLIEKYTSRQVEIIICTDHKKLTVGTKRNILVKEAVGNYIVFIDDDDMVTTDYVAKLLDKTALQPDVIVFNALRFHNGERDKTVIYGKEYSRDYSTRQFHYRIPNHLMCVKRELALRVLFADISYGEDADYAQRLLPYLKHQERIFDTLYEYWYDDDITETNTKLP